MPTMGGLQPAIPYRHEATTVATEYHDCEAKIGNWIHDMALTDVLLPGFQTNPTGK